MELFGFLSVLSFSVCSRSLESWEVWAVWNVLEKEVQVPDNQTNEVRWCQYSSTPRKTFIRRVSRKDGRQAVGTEGPLGCHLTGISPLVVS